MSDSLIGKKVLRYYVLITDGRGIIGGDNEFSRSEFSVIAENDARFVVDDRHFTVIEKLHSNYRVNLGKPAISLHANDNCWGSRIEYTLYTFSKKKASTIRKEIEKAVLDRFGFFMDGLSLGLIDEAGLQVKP